MKYRSSTKMIRLAQGSLCSYVSLCEVSSSKEYSSLLPGLHGMLTYRLKALFLVKLSPNYRRFYDAVGGILFCGSLHNETHADFAELYRRCLATDLGSASEDNVSRSLRSSDAVDVVKSVCSEFRLLRMSCRVTSFYESQTTSMKATLRKKDRTVGTLPCSTQSC